MSVEVVKEEEALEPLENCIVCGDPTSYWWGDGCAPVCTSCAKSVDERTVRFLCRKEGYDPTPPTTVKRRRKR